MSKPWEQEWRKGDGKEKHSYGVFHATGYWVVLAANEEDAQFITAAPDMARAGLRAVEGVCRFTGLDDVDVIVRRGEPVRLTAEEFGVLVASLRKAGAL